MSVSIRNSICAKFILSYHFFLSSSQGNVAADSVLHKELEKSLYVVRVTPKSYLDVFKKQDLCYLSPDTREVLDPLRMPKDVVYILGGKLQLSLT